MAFETTVLVRFAHVDPAGTVFYPRYFEMLNGAVEDWFAAMGWDFARILADANMGTPIVKLDAEFAAPSRLGDVLTIRLEPRRIGNASAEIGYTISCMGEPRIGGTFVTVCMDPSTGKAVPWPDELRGQLGDHLHGNTMPRELSG